MKIPKLTKRNSSLFLAVVLLVGTFAAISPSFIIKGVNAQSESYNYGMDDRYYKNQYENNYDSDYGMSSYDKRPYGNSYEQDYQSDYKKDYSSYGKDRDYDKSKKDDSSKSVSVNKIKCINNNVNINGNNAGNVSIGNKDAAADGGNVSGGYSSILGSDGYDNKQGKGFDCVINNNNTNTNIVSVGGGSNSNQTIPPTPPTPPVDPCEECFTQTLNATQFAALQTALENGIVIPTDPLGTETITVNSLAELCEILQSDSETARFAFGSLAEIIDRETLRELGICLRELIDGGGGPIIVPIPE